MSKANAKKKTNPEELLNGEEKEMYACKVWGLQSKLALEKEKCDVTKASQLELKQKVIMLTEDLRQEKEKLFSISMDLTNESKQMQAKLVREIEQLKSKIEDQKKTLTEKDDQIRELTKNHETASFKKDEEIRELKRKIDEMNVEFSKMMKVS